MLTTIIETVYSENCRSWYKCGKAEGRIVGLWPGTCGGLIAWVGIDVLSWSTGSGLHALKALEHPRWEDYIYEKPDKVENLLHWLGDGQTFNEKTLTGDRKCISRRCGLGSDLITTSNRGMVSQRGVH